ncbi:MULTISPECIES: hypothetical protein [Pseudovibrio]|uniref:hypothetical protein n=1 Tax=Stappiaceae TaxID=2821832 RepID=UPI002365BBCB|nr:MULTISPECIES: hypothetical protein [Pseudovibrio]MDD7911082.1 hypothetical protein [Pseudovibrio exalbescens]MDX5595695.1 hypothetical protein [Pseudovibrio sp. SPO723]
MTSEISWILTSRVTTTDPSAFEGLMQEMCGAYKENLPGTLAMIWYLSEDSQTCQLFVTVDRNETALIYHERFLTHFKARFEALMIPEAMVVYGDASTDLKAMLSSYDATYVKTVGGFVR